eukprot:3266016-Rhodomonas_salina.1
MHASCFSVIWADSVPIRTLFRSCHASSVNTAGTFASLMTANRLGGILQFDRRANTDQTGSGHCSLVSSFSPMLPFDFRCPGQSC